MLGSFLRMGMTLSQTVAAPAGIIVLTTLRGTLWDLGRRDQLRRDDIVLDSEGYLLLPGWVLSEMIILLLLLFPFMRPAMLSSGPILATVPQGPLTTVASGAVGPSATAALAGPVEESIAG